jgi:hypothetical protein
LNGVRRVLTPPQKAFWSLRMAWKGFWKGRGLMRVIESHKDLDYRLYIPASENREPGLHLSDITQPMLRERYPRWFKEYGDDESIRQARIFEKGHVVEEAWGDALARMVPFFQRPEARQKDGVWASPDGYAGPGIWTTAPLESQTPFEGHVWSVGDWPSNYPDLVLPCIFECKASLKSCHLEKSPITAEKFLGWIWNIMGYCHLWNCTDAFLMAHHFSGDYTGHPPEPVLMVHHLQWDAEELEEHWADLLTYAKEHDLG